jgi:hypothetical protein
MVKMKHRERERERERGERHWGCRDTTIGAEARNYVSPGQRPLALPVGEMHMIGISLVL